MPNSGRGKTMRGHFSRWLMAIIFVGGLCAVTLSQTNVDTEQITLIVGRSTIVRAPWPTVRVAVTDPTVADVQVLTPDQVLVQGLKVGSTDLILWSEDEQQTWQRRVLVRLDIETIRTDLTNLFPTADLEISDSGDVLVVQGLLREAQHAEQLHRYLESTKVAYVDLTSLAGIQQVQLQVRVAEVSRSALRTLGVNWFTTDEDFFSGTRVGGLVPGIDIGVPGGTPVPGNVPFEFMSDVSAGPAVTVFAGFPDSDLEFFLRALAENRYMRVLANPTLVALSGEEASFLAGGEFPIPVVQSISGGGGSGAITIQWKEYGVSLVFRPVVLGDGGIRLTAAQEVSELDFGNSLVVQGFAVPALTSRRAETTLELKSGQSFAMAGLLQRNNSAVTSKLPGLGNLPVIGPLFRSIEYRENQTELVILVTASLVEPMSTAQAPPLPGALYTPPNDWELYLEGRLEGKTPAKLDPASREWLKQMGLDDLVGPGAWDSYEDQGYPEAMRAAEAEAADRSDSRGGTNPATTESQKPGSRTQPGDKSKEQWPWLHPTDTAAL